MTQPLDHQRPHPPRTFDSEGNRNEPAADPVSSDIPEFDFFPDVRVFFPQRGGVPGVDYLYALPKNILKFKRQTGEDGHGWEQLNPPVACTIRGIDFVVLGYGEPISGASPSSRIPRMFIDKEAMGLPEFAVEAEEPSEPQPETTTDTVEETTDGGEQGSTPEPASGPPVE